MSKQLTKTRKKRVRNEVEIAKLQRRWNVRRLYWQFAAAVGAALDKGQGSVDPRWAADLLLEYGRFLNHQDLVDLFPMESHGPILIRLLRIVELKEMPYQGYLQTPEWKEIAAQSMDKFRGECALDADHIASQVHHRTYARRGHEWHTDLIPLCDACHSKFHGKRG